MFQILARGVAINAFPSSKGGGEKVQDHEKREMVRTGKRKANEDKRRF